MALSIVSNSAVSMSLKRVLEAAKVDDGNALIRDNVIRSNPNVRTERNRWLNQTEWLEMFLDKDIKILMDHASGIIRDPIEQGIVASVKRVIDDSLAGVKDLQKRGWGRIRFWLRSVAGDKPHTKPFRMYYSDLRRYISYWTRLMLFCRRTYKIEDGVQLDIKQAGILQRLEKAVSNPDPNHNRDDWEESIDLIMLEFAMSLTIIFSAQDGVLEKFNRGATWPYSVILPLHSYVLRKYLLLFTLFTLIL